MPIYGTALHHKEFPRIVKFNKEILTNFNEAVNERLKCRSHHSDALSFLCKTIITTEWQSFCVPMHLNDYIR